jgi:glycosyltransferase involved in cell wall biosynthesis
MMTVVIATRNGARTLQAVLDAYCRLDAPEGGWKLIVVDNGSTDRSREIITSFQGRLPVTYLYEGMPGKNSALNTAIAHIDGDLVLFTDDDVFPRPGWLVCMRTAADAQPSFALFGGVILPRWEIPAAGWIMEWVALDVVFGLTSPALKEGPTTPDTVWGGNMAVRADVFKRGFRFDASIGPRGANYAQGSETEFVRRMANHGYTAWHVHNAEVEHFIRDFQMQKPWVLGRAIRYGRGQYRLNHAGHSTPMITWFGAPRYLYRQILEQTVQLLKSMLVFDGGRIFRERWKLNYYRGFIIEARTLRKEQSASGGATAVNGRTGP